MFMKYRFASGIFSNRRAVASSSSRNSFPGYAAILVLILLTSGMARQASAQSITGRVSDACTLSPIPGATISVSGTEIMALTNESGMYHLATPLAPGEYLVKATAPPWREKEFKVVVGATGDTTQDFPLTQFGTCLTVTVTEAPGEGTLNTLSQIIEAANSIPGKDVIDFAIPGDGPHIIELTEPLPPITDPVIIDGYTQPGAFASSSPFDAGTNARIMIIIDGAGLPDDSNGLIVSAGPSEIRGLSFTRFSGGAGILISDGEGTVIEGNFLGVRPEPVDGPFARNLYGVRVVNASNNTIGGVDPEARNLISNNEIGVLIESTAETAPADSNAVLGNLIGPDATGTTAIPNETGILLWDASASIIGQPNAGNVISGNNGVGVSMIGQRSRYNTVYANRIGTDVTGTDELGNEFGVAIDDGASENEIGRDGLLSGLGNLISGNLDTGIKLAGGARDNLISGNLIGLDASGTRSLENFAGIMINGSSENTIDDNLISGNSADGIRIFGVTSTENKIQNNGIGMGGSRQGIGNGDHGIAIGTGSPSENTIGPGNQIANNGGAGVVVRDGHRNRITENAIFNNGQLGIALSPSGGTPRPNDPGDSDEGPNNGQNYPVIQNVDFDIGFLSVSGILDAAPSTDYTLEFFVSDVCDPSGFGEGLSFAHSESVTTGADGRATFDTSFYAPIEFGEIVTATATSSDGNTSEFSACFTGEITPPEITVSGDYLFNVLAEGIQDAGGLTTDAGGNVWVAATGSGEVLRIDPSGATTTMVEGLIEPADVAFQEDGDLFVTDRNANTLYRIPASLLENPPVDVNSEGILSLPGLVGARYLTPAPGDGAFYVGLDAEADRIVLATLNASQADTAGVVDNPHNPTGIAINGETLYIAYASNLGQLRTFDLTGAKPGDGNALPAMFTGLNGPGDLAFGSRGQLFIATKDEVQVLEPGATELFDFLNGLSGADANSLHYDPRGVLYISDRRAGRIIEVAIPQQQVLPTSDLTFHINSGGHPHIEDGSEILAIQNAIATWAAVETADLTHTFGGETSSRLASGTDGLNLVTFADDEFLFADGVLAVAAKTIVFGENPGEAHIVDADIVFNPFFVNNPSRSLRLGTETLAGGFDIQSIATHEFGHVLGLVHSGVEDATMFFVLQPDQEARTLTLDDRAWVSARYPGATFGTLGAIEGVVLNGDAPGEPVPGALVLARHTATNELVHAYTDAQGRYRVPGLPPGSYHVSIEPLDGDVHGYPLTPGHISPYLREFTTKFDYPFEFWNDARESENPGTDDPADIEAVTVASVTSGVNFITNLDQTPPSVLRITPEDGATNVKRRADILIAFSEPVEEATVASAISFGISDGADGIATPMGGTVTPVEGRQIMLFSPAAILSPETEYTFIVGPGVADLKGNVSSQTRSVTFTTEPPDVGAPTVVGITPQDGAANVFPNSTITVFFSEPIEPATISTSSFIMTKGSDVVTGGTFTPSSDNTIVTFTAPLEEASVYTLTLTSDIMDQSGNPLVPFEATFATVESAPPTLVFFGPTGEGVSVTTPVLVDFSEPIDPESIDEASFVLSTGGDAVPGTFEFLNQNSRVIFRPSAHLADETVYTVTLSDAISDVSPISQTFGGTTWTFTTAPGPQEPEIESVSPPSTSIGQIVVINGRGFDPDPDANIVTFGGTRAIVTEASLTSLTTVVPDLATEGPLRVEVDGLVSDPFNFTVVTLGELDNTVIARTSTEGGPKHTAITPDGALAYVTNSESNSVSVIDLVNLETLDESIPVGQHPLRIAIHPDGTYAYVTNFESHNVSVIDLTTNEVSEIIPVGLNPYGVAITPAGDRVYVSEYTSRGLSVIDADPGSGAFNRVVARTSTEGGPKVTTIRPDGGLAFVATDLGYEVFDIDPASPMYNAAIARTSVEGGTNHVSITPDGALAILTTGLGEIIVVDAMPSDNRSFQVIARTSTEGGKKETTITPDGTLVYATNFDSGTVTVYRLTVGSSSVPDGVKVPLEEGTLGGGLTATLTEIQTIEVGQNPEGIVIDPTTLTAVVVNSGSDDVSIIRISGTTAEELLLVLQNRVTELGGSGAIKHGQVQALSASINTALGHLSRGKIKQAVQALDVFTTKLNNFAKSGHVTPAARDELLALVEKVKARLVEGGKSGLHSVEELAEVPTEFALRQNYPNPFNPTTTIEYDIPGGLGGPVHVQLEVFNVLGQRVAVLVNQEQGAGSYRAVWNGRTLDGSEAASGVYLFRIQMGGFQEVRKMTLLR